MIYPDVYKRLSATLIDGLVFLPLIVAYGLLYHQSRTWAQLFTVLYPVLAWTYTIFFHARWGQTLGKRAVGIRVVKASGEPMSCREAFLRSAVNVLLSILVVIGTLVALSHLPEAAFGQVARAEWRKHLAQFSPVWLRWVGILSQIWSLSDLLVFLFNKKRRALHDFIAGTVVVREQAVRLEKAVPNSVP